jgi:hypothetical protein
MESCMTSGFDLKLGNGRRDIQESIQLNDIKNRKLNKSPGLNKKRKSRIR